MKKIGAGRQALVGRTTELRLYDEALADTEGRGFAIYGPPGVGKSRLADECLRIGASRGWNAARATATHGASAVPFGALAHLIPAGVTTDDVAAVFAGIASGLDGRRGKGTVILVEDIPLLDRSSLIILQRLSDAGKIFLLSTTRDGQTESPDARALTRGFGFRQVSLKNLDQEQTHYLLRSLLGGAVSRRTSYEMYLKSAGNPLFVRELVIAALDSQTMRNDGEVWELTPAAEPDTTTPQLADLVGTRLSALSPPTRALLEAVSLWRRRRRRQRPVRGRAGRGAAGTRGRGPGTGRSGRAAHPRHSGAPRVRRGVAPEHAGFQKEAAVPEPGAGAGRTRSATP
ncbi:AAA family ATPase [Streptomyces antibioticus]|uniref:AAA family ATPase n=1 Tax=Streptomyces antibioticus TaxID=1890 RepID=UPI00368F9400